MNCKNRVVFPPPVPCCVPLELNPAFCAHLSGSRAKEIHLVAFTRLQVPVLCLTGLSGWETAGGKFKDVLLLLPVFSLGKSMGANLAGCRRWVLRKHNQDFQISSGSIHLSANHILKPGFKPRSLNCAHISLKRAGPPKWWSDVAVGALKERLWLVWQLNAQNLKFWFFWGFGPLFFFLAHGDWTHLINHNSSRRDCSPLFDKSSGVARESWHFFRANSL